MRYFLVGTICAAILLVSNASSELVAQQRSEKDVNKYTIEQFLQTVNYRGSSFSPDYTKLLVSNDSTGVFNAYSMPVDGGESKQLTQSTTDSIFGVSYFPSDERFLYTSDQGGNELNHLFVQNLDGTAKDLTPGEPGERLKAQFQGWAFDDNSFYVATNERDPKYFDLYQYDAKTLERELVFKNEEGYSVGDISRDGNLIALGKTNNRDDSDIYLYNRQTKELKHITKHEGEINHAPATFSPDDKSLYMVTDADSDFRYLAKYDLANGTTESVYKSDWDVGSASFSKHGKYFGIGTNEDARTKLRVFEAATMKPIELPSIEGANIGGFGISRNEEHVVMYASSDKMPSDLFYMNFDNMKPIQLTKSLNSEINADDLVDGEVVRFKSFDGVQIPGILYKPHQASSVNKAPALVWVHGGPGGQSRIGYRALIQYLVNHGYVVYAINNRGSSGYGKKFEQMDNRNHGKGDLNDCVTSKRMLIESGYVDPDRIGIIGGSYGGYMVLAGLAFQPDEFEVGVDIFGVANWHRTVQSIPPWWEAQRKALEKELGDFDDEEYFRSISPLFHTQNIKKPLLVLQGANDPRVLKVESDEMVEAVKKNGVPCEYLVFDDEGHGFQKKENQLRGYSAILSFLDKHLKGQNQ